MFRMSVSRDYFNWHYKYSAIFLMIPPKKLIWRIIYWIVTIPHLILICMAPFLEVAKLCAGGSDEFSSNVLNLGMSGLHFVGLNRVVRWHFIKNDCDALLERIRKINLDYSVFDSGTQKMRTRNAIDKYKLVKIGQMESTCRKLFIYFQGYVILNICITYPIKLQDPVYEKWNPITNTSSLYRDYQYPLWYPFDTSISHGYYWLGFFYQPYAFLFLMCGFLCVDLLHISTIICLRTHINIIGYAFSCVDKNIDTSLTHNEVMDLRRKRITTCIKESQEVYMCAGILNNLFSSQLLVQEILWTIVICCCLYRVTKVNSFTVVSSLLTMVLVCTAEMFTFSWFTQGFTLEIIKVLDPIYGMDWINYPLKLQKDLTFIMRRLQKPFYFTLGFWLPLDMNVFITIIKTSYSFYTIITKSDN